MKRILIVSVIGFLGLSINAQSWQRANEASVSLRGEKKINPKDFVLAELDDSEMKIVLWQAPFESRKAVEEGITIPVMLNDGSIDQFEVFEYSMMEASLAQKFPDFKTFIGQSQSDQFRKIRIDYTSKGFRAVVSDESGQTYIDPYQENDKRHRIIYKRSDATLSSDWTCHLETETKPADYGNGERIVGDCSIRTFRLAVAATGEYTAYHGGTVSSGQAAIVTAINRVNQIYEQELAVRMILIANNDLLVYTNSSTDPYTNSNGITLLSENQSNLTSVIGGANYDIGHVFSTGGGGVASLGSLCEDDFKARGVTGLPQPTGDPFYIDYVCHEIGHQFGGPHTFNGTFGNCSGGNRSQSNSYEPGSGTTIMAYAGICGSDNVQNNSDPYFHSKSLELMSAEINQNDCSASLAFTNSPPQINPLLNYTVPASTPFVLEAIANDPDNDLLTFCWEQIDADGNNPSVPSSTKTTGPLFRSLPPSSSSERYLPSIDNIVNNTTDPWEVLPSVSRELNFRVTVRDKSLIPGCTDEEDLRLTVDANSGPFLVTNTSIPNSVNEGDEVSLEWDVAGTNMAPISCSSVSILMSKDGGLSYPVVLLASTPNDGAANVSIPVGITSNARIMVRSIDNVFFDINDSDFEILPGLDGFTIELSETSAEICNSNVLEFDVSTSALGSFTSPINLQVINAPSGSLLSFSSNPVLPGNDATISINGLAPNVGEFTIEVIGESEGILRSRNFNLTLEGSTSPPQLTSPANNALGQDLNPTISWNPAVNASEYKYELRTGPNGTGSLVQTGTISNNSVDINQNLSANTNYFWRVRSISLCNESEFSDDFTFTTANLIETCVSFSGTGLPKNIMKDNTPDPNTGRLIFVDIPVALNQIISDINVTKIQGSHGNVGDLAFILLSPNQTEVLLQDFLLCGNVDDFNMGFDDESELSTVDCPPDVSNIYQPSGSLSSFDNESSSGTWSMVVVNYGKTSGTITAVEIEVCYLEVGAPCALNVTSTASMGEESLQNAISCAQPGDVITISTGLNSIIDLESNGLIINKNLTLQANPSDNIIIRYSGMSSALDIASGVDLILSGINIEQVLPLVRENKAKLKYRRNGLK